VPVDQGSLGELDGPKFATANRCYGGLRKRGRAFITTHWSILLPAQSRFQIRSTYDSDEASSNMNPRRRANEKRISHAKVS
jgi:hypothetical protein